MLLEAFATLHVPKRSTVCEEVESKPVPAAGAEVGRSMIGVVADRAALVKTPVPSMVAEVLAPVVRQVRSIFRSQVRLVAEVARVPEAPPLKTMTEPKRTSKVKVPGEEAAVDILPLA